MPWADLVFTVAESKRLIAKAIPSLDVVRQALSHGTVIVCRGSTCAYVAEELTGRRLRKSSFVLGRITPARWSAGQLFDAAVPEIVLRNGQPIDGVSLAEALAELQAGDVVIKGANALDYRAGLAANLIGHPSGGTLGLVLGAVHGRGAHLVIPVGLEKLVAGDLLTAARRADEAHTDTALPRFWVFRGRIVTEIEALQILCGVEAVHVASGGICGAEGAVWLRVVGTHQQVSAALRVANEIHGEPSFLEDSIGAGSEEQKGDANDVS
ncbi:MAG: hypothetical protein N2512_13160 [Armatimonadetes bacterium]|nr:hypothetical protein [Armatimonadota bacterium]